MKTLLVLAQHPELVEEVRAALGSDRYRVIHRATVEEAEPLLTHGIADACVVDVELTGVQGAWILEKLRRHAPKIPLVIYTADRAWEWEEEAYLQGAAFVLNKPVRPRLLTALVSRLWPAAEAQRPLESVTPFAPSESITPPETSFIRSPVPTPTLGVLRDFSAILTHSLNTEGMLRQLLLLLRELLSINRAAIFLRQPAPAFGLATGVAESRRLRSTCSIGIAPGLLQHFELSLDAGIGGQVTRLGRILRRQSEEVRSDPDARKEFELLGGQVAIPILDRESVLGVAVFDGRITGEPLVNSELELIFHLLEQLGLGIRNIWLHDQLSANHEMMAGILRELSSACVVVSRDLAILHANKTARKYFTRPDRRGGDFEFNDLPQVLGSRVYQVLKTGSAISNFRYSPPDMPGTIYSVTVAPFQSPQAGVPASALLIAEDLTQSEQLHRLEVETANLRLVRNMADRLTHEIGNAMVPLSTHQQLLADKWKDAEFRSSLDNALAEGVKRVNRLVNQMRFLARDGIVAPDAFPLGQLIEDAFQEARKYQPVKAAQLKYETGSTPVVLHGDRTALKHALTEVMLNALQANPAEPKIGVRLRSDSAVNGSLGLQIEVQDNGAGFTVESAQNAVEPFFTTRNVGLGLGLTVSRKIIETHHGKLEIVPPESGAAGIVRISLPVEAAPAPAKKA